MSSRLIATLMVAFVSTCLCAQQKTQTRSHGTINVLLANKNGLVLATDSRASYNGRTINDRSRKLFQIDSKTVCSIAGFGSDPGPHWELREATGGIISAFADGLAVSHANVSFKYKINALTYAIGSRLEVLEAEVQSAGSRRPPQDDRTILIIAGFNDDGTMSISKVEVWVDKILRQDGKYSFQHRSSNVDILTISNKFVYLTSGVDDSAQSRLRFPQTFADEVGLKVYVKSVHDGSTAQIGLENMQELASFLVEDASRTTGVVGGPVQLAVLANQQVTMKVPSNLLPESRPYTTVFLDDIAEGPSPIYPMFILPPHSVMVDNHCDNSAIILNDSILIGGEFISCNFYFNGGGAYRDPSVVVTGGKLILGPDVSLDSYSVKQVRASMPELTPISYKELPDAEDVRKQIWPDQ